MFFPVYVFVYDYSQVFCWGYNVYYGIFIMNVLIGQIVFLFLVQNITCILTWFISRPLDWHQVIIFPRCFPVVSMTVCLSGPIWSRSRSSLYAKRFYYPLNEWRRSLTTKFHRNGNKTPPCGHPLEMLLMTCSPASSSAMHLLLIMLIIQLLIFPFAGFFQCLFYRAVGEVVECTL